MHAKTILLLIGGMSLSFAAVLALMVSFVHSGTPARRQAPARSMAAAARTTESAQVPAPDTRRPAGPQSSSPAQEPPQTPAEAPPQVAPDPATLRQLAELKKEIRREIDGLKKDRDAMLKTLAQSLSRMPPAEGARELAILDEESAALVLGFLPVEKQKALLAHTEARRAEALRRRLGGR